MSKKKQLNKELSTYTEKYEALEKEYKEALDKITIYETGEAIEKYLKNLAYAFIVSEGLLERFFDFMDPHHRDKRQEAIYSLTMEAELGGLWIDTR